MGTISTNKVSLRINRAFKKGKVTLGQIMVELKEAFPENPEQMQYAIEADHIFKFLLDDGYIEPVHLSRRQNKLLRQWLDCEDDTWDVGDDGHGGDYGRLEKILWRSLKRRLPRYI